MQFQSIPGDRHHRHLHRDCTKVELSLSAGTERAYHPVHIYRETGFLFLPSMNQPEQALRYEAEVQDNDQARWINVTQVQTS